MTKAIELKNVWKKYDDKAVVKDVNLEVKKGEFLTIIGSSGCGKTTVLKMINALIKPSEGDVIVRGQNIKELDEVELRRHIGYVIQGNVLFPHMSIYENMAYVPKLFKNYDAKKTKEQIKKWAEIVGIDNEMLARYPFELSGGQQQRVGIARAMVMAPDIVLMDEPFGAVDAITRTGLQEEIKRVWQLSKATILFVTHDIEEALELGTKVMVMDAGVIQQVASPEEILKNPKTDFVKKLVKKEL